MSNMPLGRRKRADEVAEHIERAISTGEFKEGEAMPSEKELGRSGSAWGGRRCGKHCSSSNSKVW